MIIREVVYDIIDSERDYQESRWPGHMHSPQEFLTYIRSYTNEALEVGARSNDLDGDVRTRQMVLIRKIAALAVAAMEQHKTPLRLRDVNPLLNTP